MMTIVLHHKKYSILELEEINLNNHFCILYLMNYLHTSFLVRLSDRSLFLFHQVLIVVFFFVDSDFELNH